MRKFLLSTAIAALMLANVPAMARTVPLSAVAQQNPQNQEVATKTVSGKVTAIGGGGTSFTLQVSGKGTDTNQSTMDFTLDPHAKVDGNVRVGSTVTVEYALHGAQNTAVAVTAQG